MGVMCLNCLTCYEAENFKTATCPNCKMYGVSVVDPNAKVVKSARKKSQPKVK